MTAGAYRLYQAGGVGETVADAWSSYPTVVFLELGALKAGPALPSGRKLRACGQWTLSTMFSWPSWTVSVAGHFKAASSSAPRLRSAALRLLVGRRLKTLEIALDGQSTRLRFTQGVTFTTRTALAELRFEPHWMLRGASCAPDVWVHVVLLNHTARPRFWARQGSQAEQPPLAPEMQ